VPERGRCLKCLRCVQSPHKKEQSEGTGNTHSLTPVNRYRWSSLSSSSSSSCPSPSSLNIKNRAPPHTTAPSSRACPAPEESDRIGSDRIGSRSSRSTAWAQSLFPTHPTPYPDRFEFARPSRSIFERTVCDRGHLVLVSSGLGTLMGRPTERCEQEEKGIFCGLVGWIFFRILTFPAEKT
jgi:hypothetical protein